MTENMATNINFEDYDDDFTDFQETEVLSRVVRSQAKYGSTSSHSFTNRKCISHLVQPNDTLQGLALKYHVSMEQIRRVNRMYTSDSLFLRPTIKIPIETDPDLSSSSSASGSRSSISNGLEGPHDSFELTIVNNVKIPPVNGSLIPEESENFTEEQPAEAVRQLPREESIDDFLSRIDSSIAKTKGQVVERNRNFPSSQSMDQIVGQQHQPSSSRRSGNRRRRSLDKEIPSFHPVAIFNNGSSPDGPTTHVITRGVKSSLRRLEKEKDDLFQL